MNWKELKDFCNSLPISELEKNVILWREDEAIIDINAEQLDEDYYLRTEDPDEGCFPESEIKSLDPDIEVTRVYIKGHPILHENF